MVAMRQLVVGTMVVLQDVAFLSATRPGHVDQHFAPHAPLHIGGNMGEGNGDIGDDMGMDAFQGHVDQKSQQEMQQETEDMEEEEPTNVDQSTRQGDGGTESGEGEGATSGKGASEGDMGGDDIGGNIGEGNGDMGGDMGMDAFQEGDDISSANSSLMATEFWSTRRRYRRRRTCDKWPVKRGRFTRHLPKSYQCHTGGGKTYLESFITHGGTPDMFTGSQAKVSFDSSGNEIAGTRKCTCDGCDDFFKYVQNKLFKVVACRHPGGRWKKHFAVYNPGADQDKTVAKCEGREESQEKSVSNTFGVEAGVAYGAFSASASFEHAASEMTSSSWSEETCHAHTWKIKAGKTLVVWQYEMFTKCYNALDMYVSELAFLTPSTIETASGTAPTSSSDGQVHLAPVNSNKCDTGATATRQQCERAAARLTPPAPKSGLYVTSHSAVPPGCFVATSFDGKPASIAGFNTNPNGVNRPQKSGLKRQWSIVCVGG